MSAKKPQRVYRSLLATGGPTWANKPNGYLLGSYRIATAPEPNSSRLTSLKLTGFDSPANNVGPWPASLGCTTNSYSSINPSSANASGSFTPPASSPLPDSCLCAAERPSPDPRARAPRSNRPGPGARHDVLLCRIDHPGEGSIRSGLAPVGAGGRNAASIIS